MVKHFKIKVSGKVQGVFFRASTKEKAEEFGVIGFVRNESDGGVYIEAEGEAEQLKQFIDWCHRGPDRARVDQCVVAEGAIKNFTDFTIQRW